MAQNIIAEIPFSYGDRNFKVSVEGGDPKIEIASTHGQNTRQIGYINEPEDGLAIVQALVKALSLEPSQIFAPEPEPEPTRFETVRHDLATNSWREETRTKGKGRVAEERRHRQQVDFWRRSVERNDGAKWLPAFDAEFGPSEPFKNAREIIDFLEDGATFTLTRQGDDKVRYFRKIDTGLVEEYTDDTFTSVRQGGMGIWRLDSRGLFASWEPKQFAEVEVRKPKPDIVEKFQALEVGDRFRFTQGTPDIRTKVSATEYIRNGGAGYRHAISIHRLTTGYTLEKVEDCA